LSNLDAGDQVLIDYGESTRPPHKCLSSYGFVPTITNGEQVDDDRVLAEVNIDGVRYEVGPTSIPEAMIEAMVPSTEEVMLTPEIATHLARRLSDEAFHLVLNRLEVKESVPEAPHEILSSKLAASLRWNQHRILLACSLGLSDWAVDNQE
jgi:hypothetical protein